VWGTRSCIVLAQKTAPTKAPSSSHLLLVGVRGHLGGLCLHGQVLDGVPVERLDPGDASSLRQTGTDGLYVFASSMHDKERCIMHVRRGASIGLLIIEPPSQNAPPCWTELGEKPS